MRTLANTTFACFLLVGLSQLGFATTAQAQWPPWKSPEIDIPPVHVWGKHSRWHITNATADRKPLYVRVYRYESPGYSRKGEKGGKYFQFRIEYGSTWTFSGRGMSNGEWPYFEISYFGFPTPQPRRRVTAYSRHYTIGGSRGNMYYQMGDSKYNRRWR